MSLEDRVKKLERVFLKKPLLKPIEVIADDGNDSSGNVYKSIGSQTLGIVHKPDTHKANYSMYKFFLRFYTSQSLKFLVLYGAVDDAVDIKWSLDFYYEREGMDAQQFAHLENTTAGHASWNAANKNVRYKSEITLTAPTTDLVKNKDLITLKMSMSDERAASAGGVNTNCYAVLLKLA
jgi:hypothetical protein